MPPISASPQNTRTGLISWLIVFVILFVVAAIFAIYYDVEFNKAQQTTTDLQKKYAALASESDLTTPEFNKPTRGGGTHVQRILKQRDAEARTITGNDKMDFETLNTTVASTLQDVENQLKAKNVAVSLTADNLLQSVRLLSNQVLQCADAVAKSQADAKAANDHAIQVTQERDKMLGEKDKQIAALQGELQTSQAQFATYQQSKNSNVSEIEQSAKNVLAEHQRRNDTLQAELAKVTTDHSSLLHQFDMLKDKLNRLRINPNESLQRADGKITRVQLGNGTVFINIGMGESVTPGLTFEVYDQHKGLPKLTPNADDLSLPSGKASIEVIKVMNGTSECRIIKTAPGQTLVEGDLIENLVYDPNTKYNFVVYGLFDLTKSGTPNASDAEMVRQLITRWGGKLQDHVSVDTDFLVLGPEPAVPVLSAEDKDNPIAQRRFEEAQKALDSYLSVKKQAIELGVPVLDQNRFLTFTGYYDQAGR